MEIEDTETLLRSFQPSSSCYHYVCYLIADMFVENVRTIQRWYKGRYFKRRLMARIHRRRFIPCIRDIFELGLTPPLKDIPLFQGGGYLYREACDRFRDSRGLL